jgi:two-component system response regulator CpxR
MSIVAIVSGLCSFGGEIAERVAERLEYTLIGDSFLEEAAQKHGTSVDELTGAVSGSPAFFNLVARAQEKILVRIKAALAGLLAQDRIVYVGPATYLIPPSISHVLRVGVIADSADRLEEAGKRFSVDGKEAAALVEKRDQELAQWTSQQISRSPWDPANFDIKLSMSSVALDEAVDLVCEGIARDALWPTDLSIQAVRDFQLTARLDLALVEAGHYDCKVSSAESNVTVTMMAKPTPHGSFGGTGQADRRENRVEEVREVCAKLDGIASLVVIPGRVPAKTLLVDDEQEYVLTLSERLEMRDIESDVVHNGSAALDMLEAGEPEVMVLDLRMPGMDGIEVLERVKRDHPAIEVIVVTGHGAEKDERLIREMGAFEYLEKPVDINTLAATIKRARAKVRGESGEDEG